jgi:hypothetical protein
MPSRLRLRLPLGLALALAGAGTFGLGCATTTGSSARFQFFAQAQPDEDLWYEKVEQWQAREVGDRPHESLPDAESVRAAGLFTGLLRNQMGRWEIEERHALASRIAEWSQSESRRHYRFDPPTSAEDDQWPTTKDLLDNDGDDCDGLDLIAYKLMREFGFPPDQLFRAVLRRDRDGANHMVTFWFEDPHDPWVIDSVGAVSQKVRHFSELPGWTPTVVFNEHAQYTPQRLGPVKAVAHAAQPDGPASD